MPLLKLLHFAALLCWCGTLLYLPALIAAGTRRSDPLFYRDHVHLTRMVFNLVGTPAALIAIGSEYRAVSEGRHRRGMADRQAQHRGRHGAVSCAVRGPGAPCRACARAEREHSLPPPWRGGRHVHHRDALAGTGQTLLVDRDQGRDAAHERTTAAPRPVPVRPCPDRPPRRARRPAGRPNTPPGKSAQL